MSNYTRNGRAIYLDVIKIMAIFMVLYNHRSTYNLANAFTGMSIKTLLLQALATICRCGVPLFFMASGALLLKKKEKTIFIFKHRVLRIFIVMIICTFIRAWGDYSIYNLMDVFFTKLNWYLYAYFDYLLMLPILREMVCNIDEHGNEYIILVFIFYTISGILQAWGYYTGFIDFAPIFNTQFASLCWSIIFSITGFFISSCGISRKMTVFIVLGAVISICISIGMVISDINNNAGANIEQLRQHFIFLPSLLIFVCIKYLCEKTVLFNSSAVKSVIITLSGITFGIFIIETHSRMIDLVNSKLLEIGLGNYVSQYYLGLIAVFVQFLVCGIITYVVKKIPIMRKIL